MVKIIKVIHVFIRSSVNFSQDGKKLVSGSKDEWVYLWDVESGKNILAFDFSKD